MGAFLGSKFLPANTLLVSPLRRCQSLRECDARLLGNGCKQGRLRSSLQILDLRLPSSFCNLQFAICNLQFPTFWTIHHYSSSAIAPCVQCQPYEAVDADAPADSQNCF